MHALMRAHPFATIVSSATGGLTADHVPLVLHEATQGHKHGRGVLWGHVAAGNPLFRETSGAIEVLAIFQGPQSYVTPSWYASKKEHGKVVPTWNYVVVSCPWNVVLRARYSLAFGSPARLDHAARTQSPVALGGIGRTERLRRAAAEGSGRLRDRDHRLGGNMEGQPEQGRSRSRRGRSGLAKPARPAAGVDLRSRQGTRSALRPRRRSLRADPNLNPSPISGEGPFPSWRVNHPHSVETSF